MNGNVNTWPIKRYHTLVSSTRYTDHENFWQLDHAISYAKHMIGSWNNMNPEYVSEQYTEGHIIDRETGEKVWDSNDGEEATGKAGQ